MLAGPVEKIVTVAWTKLSIVAGFVRFCIRYGGITRDGQKMHPMESGVDP
jgi:hypothetical protein